MTHSWDEERRAVDQLLAAFPESHVMAYRDTASASGRTWHAPASTAADPAKLPTHLREMHGDRLLPSTFAAQARLHAEYHRAGTPHVPHDHV